MCGTREESCERLILCVACVVCGVTYGSAVGLVLKYLVSNEIDAPGSIPERPIFLSHRYS